MKLKLSEDAPEQHMAILGIAGAMILISVLSSLGGKGSDQPPAPKGSYAETGEPKYANPQLTWYEKFFCRGYQRSFGCGLRVLHPNPDSLAEQGPLADGQPVARRGSYNCRAGDGRCGAFVQGDGPASGQGVMRYSGHLRQSRGLGGKIVFDSSDERGLDLHFKEQ